MLYLSQALIKRNISYLFAGNKKPAHGGLGAGLVGLLHAPDHSAAELFAVHDAADGCQCGYVIFG